jgi:subtilisin family serine protease
MVSSRRRAVFVALALVAAATIGGPARRPTPAAAAPPGPAAADPPAPTGVLPAGRHWSVTLISGERVAVASDSRGRVQARLQGATGTVQTVREPDGDVYILPTRVLGLLEGTLDRELFNVTGLVRQGFDDAHTKAIPVLLQHPAGLAAATERRAAGPAERHLDSIDATAVELPKGGDATGELLHQLAGSADDDDGDGARRAAAAQPRVWLDRRVEVTRGEAPATPAAATPAAPALPGLDWNLQQIGADRAWQAGFDGDGATVAVLDTGIDATHPDLQGRIVAQENFSTSPDTVDRYGHGTHVAATIAGTGAAAPGVRSGVAPHADLLVGKVLDDDGFGSISDVIAGMEWAAPQADIVSMSLGSSYPPDGTGPVAQAADQLSAQHDTLFVVAAGNSGPASTTIGDPAGSARALTVGAVDRDDALAEFSSRGPLAGNHRAKPELVAPGVDVVAARAAGTAMGTPVDSRYTSASGTSMATPHVAGAAADLVEAHPDWSAEQLKDALVGSTDALDADGYDVGSGRLDVGAAVSATVRPGQGMVDVTLPHPRPDAHDETLTWVNTGTTPRTVALTAELDDRDGVPTKAATVTPSTLTVAPGATATATLRIDGPALADGLHPGAVVATADDGTATRTPLAVWAEPRMVDLTIASTAPAGTASDQLGVFANVTNLDDYAVFNWWDVVSDPSYTLRVPAGRYSVVGTVGTRDSDNQVRAQVGDPDVPVDGDTTVRFDGAGARPLAPEVTGVHHPRPYHGQSNMLTTPARGTGGIPLIVELSSYYPSPPILMAPMEGGADVFATFTHFRVQAAPLTARIGEGGSPLDVTPAGPVPLTAGRRTLTAVDAGDGSDLSATAGKLAVVQLPVEASPFPWDPTIRAAITRRAAEAGTAMVAFVDPARSYVDAYRADEWAPVPAIAAGGSTADALRAAGQAGQPVTITTTASPYVYDITRPLAARSDPAPVVGRAEQRRLATIEERFNRDPDGTGPTSDARGLVSPTVVTTYLATAGPLPRHRTAHVTPGVIWDSSAVGPYVGELFPGWVTDLVGDLSMDAGVRYRAGSHQQLSWLNRPQWPGPTGATFEDYFCPAGPTKRTADTMFVHLVPFQDRLGRFTCGDALDEVLTLSQDGTVVGTTGYSAGTFRVTDAPATFRLSYEQHGRAPYVHHSTSAWTFRSQAPTGGEAVLPLLVVGYDLGLDTFNRPTRATATFTVTHIAPGGGRVQGLQVWTSTDHGTTWVPAPVRRAGAEAFRVGLPTTAPDGTPISLRVDATDSRGGRIEQTLIDAYVA